MNTSAVKRPSDALVPVVNPKKSRTDIVAYTAKDKQLLEQNVERTSGLLGPIMLLEGHGGEIFSTEFHPEGEHLLSTGFDRQIFLWKVYDECENVGVLSGHSGAVMEAHFSPDGSNIYTCATDKYIVMPGTVQQIDVRLEAVREIVSNHLVPIAPVHVLDPHARIQRRADGDDVNVVRLLVHRFHLLVAELHDRNVPVDKVLIKVGLLLQMARGDQAQIHHHVVRVALLVEQLVQLGQGSGRIVALRLHLADHLHERFVKVLDRERREAGLG
uniref:WD repeat-containing protein 55 homolog n=1 Tax=Anopheles coluzzii TaxID=1518534 RepID=A0A8W7PIK5_ANOCL